MAILTFIILSIKSQLLKLFRGEFLVFTSGTQPPTVMERVWQKQKFHYDNVAAAMLTLFAVQTTEGWPA